MDTIGFVYPACGHWLLGAKSAGFKLLWFFEKGKLEYETCKLNFPEVKSYFGHLNIDQIPKPDVIVGSPPCKGFSHGINFRQIDIPENSLLEDFGLLVGQLKPKIFLLENVPYVLKRWDHLEKCKSNLIGYNLTETLLNATDFGGNQNRKRYFLAGVRRDLGLSFLFPELGKVHHTVKEIIWDLEDLPSSYYPEHIWDGKIREIMGTVRTLAANKPSWTITGWSYRWRHYNQVRNISLLELKRLMGLPDSWILPQGSIQKKTQAIAEGVDVNLLRFLFLSLIKNLSLGES